MKGWRSFINDNAAILNDVEAYPVHFAIATRWLYYTCAALYAGKNTDKADAAVAKDVIKNCNPMIEYVPLDGNRRFSIAHENKQGNEQYEDLNARRIDPSRYVQPTPASPAPTQNVAPAQVPRSDSEREVAAVGNDGPVAPGPFPKLTLGGAAIKQAAEGAARFYCPQRCSAARCSRTPRRASARVALHAGAVAHQREVRALAAHLALVAFGLCFGSPLGGDRLGVALRLGPG